MTMRYELLAHRILERAATQFPGKEIVTRVGEGVHRYTYADLLARAARLGNALRELGIGAGDRVGTFAWNTYRHLEAYFAPATIGAVTHTINIRLAPDTMAYIINHAGDKALLIDPTWRPSSPASPPVSLRCATTSYWAMKPTCRPAMGCPAP